MKVSLQPLNSTAYKQRASSVTWPFKSAADLTLYPVAIELQFHNCGLALEKSKQPGWCPSSCGQRAPLGVSSGAGFLLCDSATRT